MIAENYKNHSVFEKLEQLKQVLSTENANEKLGTDNFVYFESFYLFIKDRLKLTIPILIQEAELNALSSEIEAGTVQLNAFFGNNNSGHIQNAVNNFNSALNRVRTLPVPISKGDFDFSKAIAIFEETTKISYSKLDEINKKLQEDLKVTQENLVAKTTQLTTLEQQLGTKETEILNFLNNYTTEFETLKTNNSTTFESEIKKFNDNIENDRKLFTEQFDEDKIGFQKKFETQSSKFDNDSVELINKLNAKLAEANKIVNIVGNVGVTGNYQNIANQHKTSANFFRWVALSFMVVMSTLLIWSIIDLSKGEFDIYKSLIRILAAAVLTYPAIYASRESNKHRILETQNRNLELELASIGPFIELLPEDKKQAIKEDLVKKYFGNQISTTDPKDEDISINGLEKILKTILPFVKK
jgi:hypothetical protein